MVFGYVAAFAGTHKFFSRLSRQTGTATVACLGVDGCNSASPVSTGRQGCQDGVMAGVAAYLAFIATNNIPK